MSNEFLHEIIRTTAIKVLGITDKEASILASTTIEKVEAESPDVSVYETLPNKNGSIELLSELGQLSRREVERFVAYAKEQGTKMPFDAVEMGILAAGQKDMQNGLAEILDTIKFDKPEGLDYHGRGKKKILTAVGTFDIHPARFAIEGQSAYPLLDYIGLIECKELLDDGSTATQTVKCTRNAAASIALACAESSYEHSALLLKRLAGLDVSVMTEFRATDSVASEFVKDRPAEIDPGRIEEMMEKVRGNALQARIEELDGSENKEEIIKKALESRPDGVFYKTYDGPTIKVMYILGDGTGVPGLLKELAGVKGKQSDGSAKTFEAKVGAVFTVEYTADGKPLLTEDGEIYRDKKVSYMGTVRKAEDFGPMLYQHATENGLEAADVVVFLGDGAKWLWNIQQTYFPYALTCLDLYHAIEHVNATIDLIQFTAFGSSYRKQAFKDECIELLRYGKTQNMLELIEKLPVPKYNEEKFATATGYFRSNKDRMNYGAFAACGIYVGSGVIEAACKVIVANRMKNAGMHWTKDHAEKMINLRCAIRNGIFLDSYLNDRTASVKTAA